MTRESVKSRIQAIISFAFTKQETLPLQIIPGERIPVAVE